MNARRIAWSIVALLPFCAATRALDPIAILSPSDVPPGYSNSFAWSVAISGDYIVVGAPRDPVYNGDATGAVYVFRRVGPTWVEQVKLTVSQPSWQDQLGWSVAIDGDVIVAGAPRWDFVGCDVRRAGAAYVFRRDDQGTPDDPADDTWFEQGKLTIPDPQLSESLGMSVAISGDVVVAGSECAGAVQVFRWNGSDWNHETSLTGSNMEGRYGFGSSVAIDGNRIVSGAYGNHTGPGAAYVFLRDGTVWGEEDVLVPTDHTTPDGFGSDVSISGDRVVVGASGIGSTYIFTRTGDKPWLQEGRLTGPGFGAREYGHGVAIDTELLVVAASGDPWAYLFRREENAWIKSSALFGVNWSFPLSVTMRGKYALVYSYVYAVRDQRSLQDYAGFQACFTGGMAPGLSVRCQPFDLSGDGRVDLIDFEDFVGTLIGP